MVHFPEDAKAHTGGAIAELRLPAQYRKWATCAARLGFTDFLSAEDNFRTELSSGSPWENSSACGVYFWIAQDGETYVGETVNARNRLRTHWRKHPDLAYAAFQIVPAALRKMREKALLNLAGAEFPTRNIKLAMATKSYVPFDTFVGRSDSDAFVQGRLDLPDLNWRELPLLEQKQSKKWIRFQQARGCDAALAAFATFAHRVIPKIAATEARFWSVSLFVPYHLLRVNAGQQEVFTVLEGNDGSLYARVFSGREYEPEPDGPMYQTQSFEAIFPVEELGLGPINRIPLGAWM